MVNEYEAVTLYDLDGLGRAQLSAICMRISLALLDVSEGLLSGSKVALLWGCCACGCAPDVGGVKVIFEVKELSVTALHRQGEGCSRAYHEAGPCTEHHKTVQMRTDGPKFFCALRYVLTR